MAAKTNVVRIHALTDEDERARLGIVAGIPVSAIRRRRPRFVEQLTAARMNDSFLTKLNRAGCYRHAEKLGLRITVRAQADGYIRVWRKTP